MLYICHIKLWMYVKFAKRQKEKMKANYYFFIDIH